MDKETKEALESSIKHWEENVAATDLYEIDTSIFSCSLCGMFFGRDCVGCPISNKTSQGTCEGTPYYEVTNSENIKEAHKHSKEMLEFLKGLRTC